MTEDVERLLDRLRVEIDAELGDRLLGLYVYGSWTDGDFAPERSDVDLLAVLSTDPDEALVGRLSALHDRVAADHPAWTGRVEVEYVSLDGLTEVGTAPHPMARISPGEPLHLVSTSRHYLINWFSARQAGRALAGPRPALLMPEIDQADMVAVVREHVAQWPEWVEETETVGFQAYAVLTLCRALGTVTDGGRRSKRAAASWAEPLLPEWAELIGWATRWWYEGGSDDEPRRSPEVRAFVVAVAQRIETT